MKISKFFSFIIIIFFSTINFGMANEKQLSYKVSVIESNIFSNAYSYVKLNIDYNNNLPSPAYIEIPKFISNEPQIQKVFKATNGVNNGKHVFEIFFPLPDGINSIDLKIYPENTDLSKINNNTLSFKYTLDVSHKNKGSALMLYQENKEKNVRVFKISESLPGRSSKEYVWYGTVLPEAKEKINKAIVHITEENGNNLISNLSFKRNRENIYILKDPANEDKNHIYLFTNETGKATLEVEPKRTPSSGLLAYWPFSDTSSEAMRIVVFDDNAFGDGLQAPIPDFNPIKYKENSSENKFKFKINNQVKFKKIKNGGSIYIIVNGEYKKTIPSSDDDIITFEIDDSGIDFSKTERPESNNIQYIYTDNKGYVGASRKRAFFALSEGPSQNIDQVPDTKSR